jgi:hypothetical protein
MSEMNSKLAAMTIETNKQMTEQMTDIRANVSNEIRSLRSDIAINYARLLSQISRERSTNSLAPECRTIRVSGGVVSLVSFQLSTLLSLSF